MFLVTVNMSFGHCYNGVLGTVTMSSGYCCYEFLKLLLRVFAIVTISSRNCDCLFWVLLLLDLRVVTMRFGGCYYEILGTVTMSLGGCFYEMANRAFGDSDAKFGGMKLMGCDNCVWILTKPFLQYMEQLS